MQPNQFSNYRFRQPKNKIAKTTTDYSKFITYTPALLILLGVSRLSFYYEHFNVNIFPFLEFSEIITSFLDIIVVFVYLICAFIFAITLTNVSNLIKSLTLSLIVGFLIVLPSMILIMSLIFGSIDTQSSTMLVFLIFAFPILSLLLTKTIEKKYSQTTYLTLYFLASVCLCMAAIWLGALNSYRSVTRYKKYAGVKILRSDSSFVDTDSSNYYIGNTANYIFIYNEKTDRTTVEKMTDIKSIEFPKTNKP